MQVLFEGASYLTVLQKRWEIMPPAPAEHLAGFPDLPPLVVQLLYNRQMRAKDEVQAFLSRSFGPDNPFRLKGMNEAVTRLRHAIRGGEAIAVYGDYDVDGVTGTALLVPTLRALGAAHVVSYIPNRMEEGYGLNEPALAELADQGIKLVVTVDCGVRSVKEVAYANGLGLDLIITDHHAVGEELPPAVAVIDARREDDRYPFKHLAGVGLAFKLAQALLRAERQMPVSQDTALPQEEDWLDLVALGTVADLAPLIGENRALVSRGIEKLNEARRVGIGAMLKEARLAPGQVDAGKIGFVLGPRLNAAGRLDDAVASYNLLTTSSVDEAAALAEQLGAQNRERQQLMHDMVERAREEVHALGDQRIYVLASPAYMSGIAGLVASRITEEFYRPSLVIALEEKYGKGSARSIPGFHITKALDECEKLLEKHGGHAAAAGFTIKKDNINAFRDELRRIADRELDTEEDLVPLLEIDAALPLTQANWENLGLVQALQPFGARNPHPTFVSYDVRVRDARSIGSEGRSLKLKLSDGVAVWDAFAFRQGLQPDQVPRRIDVVYTMQSDVWNNKKRMRLVVKDLRPAERQAPSSNE
jgi:single-stranded-DNA-specific exonuclease